MAVLLDGLFLAFGRRDLFLSEFAGCHWGVFCDANAGAAEWVDAFLCCARSATRLVGLFTAQIDPLFSEPPLEAGGYFFLFFVGGL